MSDNAPALSSPNALSDGLPRDGAADRAAEQAVTATPTAPVQGDATPSASTERAPRQKSGNHLASAILKPIASLKLTVALFGLSIFLVLAGTLAQADEGIWVIMSKYFRTWYVPVEFGLFFPRGWEVPGVLPFPGGWTIGTLLLANLLAAHALRFKVKARNGKLWGGLGLTLLGSAVVLAALEGTLVQGFFPQLTVSTLGSLILIPATMMLFDKRAGIVLLHAGIIVMLLSELLTGVYANEANMNLEEGSYANYTSDPREYEFAVIDASDEKQDKVVVIPQAVIERALPTMQDDGKAFSKADPISHALLPFTVRFDRFYPNSLLENMPTSTGPAKPNVESIATKGAGTQVGLAQRKLSTGTDSDTVDYPSAYITLLKDGKELGTYLASSMWTQPVDEIEVDGKTYKFALRFKREYKPYQIHLLDAKHDIFTGTDIPRNFSSEVRVVDTERGVDRKVLIYMNHPFRYRGETFYQYQMAAGKNAQGVERSTLQVVRNPAWGGPYISCIIVSIGMLMHFGITLTRFLSKQFKDPQGVAHVKP